MNDVDSDDHRELNPEDLINPEFEYDDTGFELAARIKDDEEDLPDGTSTMGVIEEDFEGELGDPAQVTTVQDVLDEEYRDISRLSIINVCGDDKLGRKVITLSACRLPVFSIEQQDRLLEYLIKTLAQFVTCDYSLVYFHYGLTRRTCPSLKWIISSYKDLHRSFKKNLKALYLVHPTFILRNFMAVLFKIVSPKFSNKLVMIQRIDDLRGIFHLDQLCIPDRVISHDMRRNQKDKVPSSSSPTSPDNKASQLVTSCQYVNDKSKSVMFGIRLEEVRLKNHQCFYPPVLEDCVTYLRECGLQTEGLFRRSTKQSLLLHVQERYDRGESVNLKEYNDPHLAAVLIKTFLRSLEEPIFPFEMNEEIVSINSTPSELKVLAIRDLVCEQLPQYNYLVLSFLVDFLHEVEAHSAVNRMTVANLAIVLTPSLIWTANHKSSIVLANIFIHFVSLLIRHSDEIFLK